MKIAFRNFDAFSTAIPWSDNRKPLYYFLGDFGFIPGCEGSSELNTLIEFLGSRKNVILLATQPPKELM